MDKVSRETEANDEHTNRNAGNHRNRIRHFERVDGEGESYGENCRLIEDGVFSKDITSDEALAPFRRQVEESGISDEELDDLFMQARRDYYREQMERR